jgi:hypothetical protein
MASRFWNGGLSFPRCRRCSNVLPDQVACSCEAGICISCNTAQASHFNLCHACEKWYLWRFHPAYDSPASAHSLKSWIRQRFNNLQSRHGVLGSFADFHAFFHRSHRSLRLWFPRDLVKKFDFHRANDTGRYKFADGEWNVFTIPRTENNLARSYSRIDNFDRVLEMRSRCCTYEEIYDLLSVPPATACRWVKAGTKLVRPLKKPFLEYSGRPS